MQHLGNNGIRHVKILITGKAGQLGTELARIDWPAHFELSFADRAQCDLSNPAAIVSTLDAVRPDLVVNAAAYTAVDRAESDAEAAMRVNGEGPAILAQECARTTARLIHVSTDYVFDGSSSAPYREGDPVGPLSVYGRTKAAGESSIRNVLERHVIVRTSWVFSSHGSNFVKTMLRLSSENPILRVVADQKGSPTWAADLARTIQTVSTAIANGNEGWGTFHFSSEEPTSWQGFASAIFERCGRSVRVEPISSAEFAAAALRPKNSVLDCSKIRKVYGIVQPSWRKGLECTLAELGVARRDS